MVISKLARPVHPVFQRVAENLGKIDVVRIVKITPGFLQASSEVIGARAAPVTVPGHPSAVGVSLILDEDYKDIQFYEITSAVKGYGSRMVEAVLDGLPQGWEVIVLMDSSGGFWDVMSKRYKRVLLM